MQATMTDAQGWREEASAFGRAFGGAALIGIPLLFTMEMWWIGQFADLWKLVVMLVLAFVANTILAYLAGFKHIRHTNLPIALDQAVDTIAVGIVGSTIVLLVMNQLRLSEPLDALVGKIIVQAVPLSIGASLANAIFSPGRTREGDSDDGSDGEERDMIHEALNDLGAATIGSILVAFAIAPTEEIPMLAAEMGFYHELAMVALSLLLGWVIVFVSGFDPQTTLSEGQRPGPFQRPVTETVAAYIVSLTIALIALFLFDQIEIGDPLSSVVTKTLVLGLPATIGGAAGRLAV